MKEAEGGFPSRARLSLCARLGYTFPVMKSDGLPYPDSDDDAIAPDVAPREERPIDPAAAVRCEQEKYGESSADENRGDQWDEHHGQPDDIV
jgi:hypothetical protein